MIDNDIAQSLESLRSNINLIYHVNLKNKIYFVTTHPLFVIPAQAGIQSIT